MKPIKYKTNLIITGCFFASPSWWNNAGLMIQYDFLDGAIRYTLYEIEI